MSKLFLSFKRVFASILVNLKLSTFFLISQDRNERRRSRSRSTDRKRSKREDEKKVEKKKVSAVLRFEMKKSRLLLFRIVFDLSTVWYQFFQSKLVTAFRNFFVLDFTLR